MCIYVYDHATEVWSSNRSKCYVEGLQEQGGQCWGNFLSIFILGLPCILLFWISGNEETSWGICWVPESQEYLSYLHLLKWRNLEVEDVPQSSSRAQLYAANMTVEDIVKGMSFCASFSMVIYHVSYLCCCKCQVSTLGMKTRKSQQPILMTVKSTSASHPLTSSSMLYQSWWSSSDGQK